MKNSPNLKAKQQIIRGKSSIGNISAELRKESEVSEIDQMKRLNATLKSDLNELIESLESQLSRLQDKRNARLASEAVIRGEL